MSVSRVVVYAVLSLVVCLVTPLYSQAQRTLPLIHEDGMTVAEVSGDRPVS